MDDILTLRNSNCKNCYKCIRQCPVKSISFSGDQASIIKEECVLCGKCYIVCPQPNKEIFSEIGSVKDMIKDKKKVIASVAPSFAARFNTGIEAVESSLRKLGFYAAEETAIGAAAVKNEYERILREEKPDVLISSCCHSVNLLISKHYPSLLKYLAAVDSPMEVHAKNIKSRHPDAKVVFIGPCISKKHEASDSNSVDAALTFDELAQMLECSQIENETRFDKTEKSKTRLFPTAGGIIASMNTRQKGYTYITVSGISQCCEALKEIENGTLRNCFIEMSSCENSCSGGPVMGAALESPLKNYQTILEYAGNEDFDFYNDFNIRKSFKAAENERIMPTEAEIRDILVKMGKTNSEHELNCGSCGYDSCREKAIAIFQGKADPNMCLPYLNEKAESFSSNIINHTLNAVFVLDDDYHISLINKAALRLIGAENANDIIGKHITELFNPAPFINAKLIGEGVVNQKAYLDRYNKYVDQTILYDKEYHTLICNMRDISEEETVRQKKEAISKKTVEIADKVVEKQMRIVQDIASLLGETAAETKIALFNLKESISDD
ncbi:MAG: [Fe-Fe] hydrogenase large subunit C-terminal domain-containing protein [Acutalibacteraceae bacterium]